MSAQTTTSAQTDHLELVLRALASKPRREIVRILASGEDDDACCTGAEVCACVFSDKLGLGAPTVSHHMKVLLEAGLIGAEKRGQWVYYRLEPQAVRALADELLALAGCD